MEPIVKSLPYPVDDLEQKTIQFRVMADRTTMTDGNGILEMSELPDGEFSVAISVTEWPSSGVGTVKTHRLTIPQRVVDLIRKTPDEEFELSCVDPRTVSE